MINARFRFSVSGLTLDSFLNCQMDIALVEETFRLRGKA